MAAARASMSQRVLHMKSPDWKARTASTICEAAMLDDAPKLLLCEPHFAIDGTMCHCPIVRATVVAADGHVQRQCMGCSKVFADAEVLMVIGAAVPEYLWHINELVDLCADNCGLLFNPFDLRHLMAVFEYDCGYKNVQSITDVLKNPVLIENAQMVFGIIYRDWMHPARSATDFLRFLIRHQQCCGIAVVPTTAECAEQIYAAVGALHTAYTAVTAAHEHEQHVDDCSCHANG
jgi:hypothetical protein